MGSCISWCSAQPIRLNEHEVHLAGMIGQGGYSYVYEARDVNTGRLYALKLMRCTDEVVEVLFIFVFYAADNIDIV